MKLEINGHQGKPTCLEEGLLRYEIPNEEHDSRRIGKTGCNRSIQFIKFILYLELILFIGWAGCIFLTNYYRIDGYERPSQSYEASKGEEDVGKGYLTIDSASAPDTIYPSRQTESHAESATTTTTTSSSDFVETNANVVNESMLLSKWLETLPHPWKKSEETLLTSDDFWKRIMSSEEEKSDKSNGNIESAVRNHFSKLGDDPNEFEKVDVDRLVILPLWSDYSEDASMSDQDPLRDNRFRNLQFDFVFPELVDHYLSQRSTESSSSEENKTPLPKVKRSADSSSSESDSSDSSSSSSSSLEKEHTTMETTKGDKSCPKIYDEDGDPIDDPAEIVNHIKKNWFNWLLETPVPDCEGPQSLKTVSLDECGKFIVKCTSDETSDETGEKSKESGRKDRRRRNVEETDDQAEKCKLLITSLPDSLEELLNDIFNEVPDPDPKVDYSKRDLLNTIITLMLQAAVEPINGAADKSDEEWKDSLVEMKRKILESIPVEEFRQELDKNSTITLEMGVKLRGVVEKIVTVYKDCQNAQVTSPEAKAGIRVLTIMTDKEKCIVDFEKAKKQENSLANLALTIGDESDPIVSEVRQRFKKLLKRTASYLSVDEVRQSQNLPAGLANITDEQWQLLVNDIRNETAYSFDEPLRQRILSADPPTELPKDQLINLMNFYITQEYKCKALFFYAIGAFDDKLISLDADKSNVAKRSIGYPEGTSDNSMTTDEKPFSGNDESPSSRRSSRFSDHRDFENFLVSPEIFSRKMEMLASHVDRLHELFERHNELSDDYVSEEFPIDVSLDYGY